MSFKTVSCVVLVALLWAPIEASGGRSASRSDFGFLDDLLSSTAGWALTVVLGVAYTTTKLIRSSVDDDEATQQAAARALSRYLRQNHATVTRDVLTAQGPFWAQWQTGIGLTSAEFAVFQRDFSASAEQTAMLELLDSPLDPPRALRFADALSKAMRKSLGDARFGVAVKRARAHSRTLPKKPT